MNKGITLLEVLVIVIVIAILAALVVPPICGKGRVQRAMCENNLKHLHTLANIYSSQNRGFEPIETGQTYWLRLSKVHPPLIKREDLDLFLCPVKGDSNDGEVDYRGPVTRLAIVADGDPIGADKLDNHGAYEGGNVLLRSGAVLLVERNTPLWAQCREKLSP